MRNYDENSPTRRYEPKGRYEGQKFCYYCKRKSHWEDECFVKKKDFERNKSEKRKRNKENAKKDEEFNKRKGIGYFETKERKRYHTTDESECTSNSDEEIKCYSSSDDGEDSSNSVQD